MGHLTPFHNLDIVLLCGLYGSGKTEIAVKYFKGRDRHRISRSEIRRNMYEMTNFGDTWKAEYFNEADDALVKHIERKILEQYIHNKTQVIIVNTFVAKKSRKRFIDLAHSSKRSIGAIFINRPLEKCIERNSKAEDPVPEGIIYRLAQKIELPEKSEGFDEVLTLKA